MLETERGYDAKKEFIPLTFRMLFASGNSPYLHHQSIEIMASVNAEGFGLVYADGSVSTKKTKRFERKWSYSSTQDHTIY